MTIYELLKESGVNFTPTDSNNIGMAVRKHYKQNPPKFSKIEITEAYSGKSKKVWVRDYPDDCKSEIESVIVKYFSKTVL